MPRVKRGVSARASHKKILKQAKGYYGARSRVFRVAKQAVIKAGQYAYRDRRQKKRQLIVDPNRHYISLHSDQIKQLHGHGLN